MRGRTARDRFVVVTGPHGHGSLSLGAPHPADGSRSALAAQERLGVLLSVAGAREGDEVDVSVRAVGTGEMRIPAKIGLPMVAPLCPSCGSDPDVDCACNGRNA